MGKGLLWLLPNRGGTSPPAGTDDMCFSRGTSLSRTQSILGGYASSLDSQHATLLAPDRAQRARKEHRHPIRGGASLASVAKPPQVFIDNTLLKDRVKDNSVDRVDNLSFTMSFRE